MTSPTHIFYATLLLLLTNYLSAHPLIDVEVDGDSAHAFAAAHSLANVNAAIANAHASRRATANAIADRATFSNANSTRAIASAKVSRAVLADAATGDTSSIAFANAARAKSNADALTLSHGDAGDVHALAAVHTTVDALTQSGKEENDNAVGDETSKLVTDIETQSISKENEDGFSKTGMAQDIANSHVNGNANVDVEGIRKLAISTIAIASAVNDGVANANAGGDEMVTHTESGYIANADVNGVGESSMSRVIVNILAVNGEVASTNTERDEVVIDTKPPSFTNANVDGISKSAIGQTVDHALATNDKAPNTNTAENEVLNLEATRASAVIIDPGIPTVNAAQEALAIANTGDASSYAAAVARAITSADAARSAADASALPRALAHADAGDTHALAAARALANANAARAALLNAPTARTSEDVPGGNAFPHAEVQDEVTVRVVKSQCRAVAASDTPETATRASSATSPSKGPRRRHKGRTSKTSRGSLSGKVRGECTILTNAERLTSKSTTSSYHPSFSK